MEYTPRGLFTDVEMVALVHVGILPPLLLYL
jgi:hypothetical protein